MGIKQKIGNKILNSSGSVQHYKKQIDKLTKKVERLEKENNSTNRILNVNNFEVYLKDIIKRQRTDNPNIFFVTFNKFKNNVRKIYKLRKN